MPARPQHRNLGAREGSRPSTDGVKGRGDGQGAHAVKMLEVVHQGRPKRRINAVLDAVLVSNALDDRRKCRVVGVVDAGEEVVHSLVVEAAADMCPEQRVVREVCCGGKLRCRPAACNFSTLVLLQELHFIHHMRHLLEYSTCKFDSTMLL